MIFFNENYVRTAVERVGGITRTSNQLGVANQTVSIWVKNMRVPNIDLARRLSELSGGDLPRLRPTG